MADSIVEERTRFTFRCVVLWLSTDRLYPHASHQSDVTMSDTASQTASIPIVYSTVCPGVDEKYQTLRHWPLWGEFTGDRWIPHKGPVTRKLFLFDDVIMKRRIEYKYAFLPIWPCYLHYMIVCTDKTTSIILYQGPGILHWHSSNHMIVYSNPGGYEKRMMQSTNNWLHINTAIKP